VGFNGIMRFYENIVRFNGIVAGFNWTIVGFSMGLNGIGYFFWIHGNENQQGVNR